jgi:ParB family chromosome partitioning protein
MARTTTAPSTETVTTTAQSAPVAVLAHLDPATLLVDLNPRHDARLDAAFLALVKDQGVLVPLVAVRTASGEIRVRFGHRRTLTAVATGLPTVPVVVAADGGTDDAGQVARLVAQWAENEHRTGLSTAERVDVTAQLAALGISAAQIAKRTKTPRVAVEAALAVAGCDLAKAATARYGVPRPHPGRDRRRLHRRHRSRQGPRRGREERAVRPPRSGCATTAPRPGVASPS